MADESKMAIDDNNNIGGLTHRTDNRLKKKLTSMKNFFTDILGKTASMPLGLDGSTVDTKFRTSSPKKNARQGSMPILRSPKQQQQQHHHKQQQQQHPKLTRNNHSVPLSLNLPRARYGRPILSTNSLNKADVNEEWLKPVRFRSYVSNGSIDYSQSDVSVENLSSSSTRNISRTYSKGDVKKRSSFLKKRYFGSITEGKGSKSRVRFSNENITKNSYSQRDLSTGHWPRMQRNSLSKSADLRRYTVGDYVRKNSTTRGDVGPRTLVNPPSSILKKSALDSKMKSQSEKNLLHLGSFVCTVERSSSSTAVAQQNNNDDVFIDDVNSKALLRRTFSDSSAIGLQVEPLQKNASKEKTKDSPVITVQIDHDLIFGTSATSKSRQKKISVHDKKTLLTNTNNVKKETSNENQENVNKETGSKNVQEKMSFENANNVNKKTSVEDSNNVSKKTSVEDSNNVRKSTLQLPAVKKETLHLKTSWSEVITHVSTLPEDIQECFSSSFWDDTETLLSIERIREIAESEARQVVAEKTYNEIEVPKWTKEITCNVRDNIRAYTGRQFKIIVNTFVGALLPSNHDTVNVAVRGLTEPSTDRFVVSAFEKDDMFISVTCALIKNLRF